MKSITPSMFLVLGLLACGQPSVPATAVPSASNVDSTHSELITSSIHVEGMTCRACENSIKNLLKKKAGVREVTASHAENSVVVTYERDKISLDEIKVAISDLGYQIK